MCKDQVKRAADALAALSTSREEEEGLRWVLDQLELTQRVSRRVLSLALTKYIGYSVCCLSKKRKSAKAEAFKFVQEHFPIGEV